MFWKKENQTEKKLDVISSLLRRSFSNVKRDTTNIFQWLNFLYRKSAAQEERIKQLQTELKYMPKSREDIRHIIDDYYSFESIMAKIRELDYKINQLSMIEQSKQKFQSIKTEEPSEKIEESEISYIEERLNKLEQRKESIKEKLVKKLVRNSKDYIKNLILSYIRKYGKISALQLKEIVVNEQNFCSKSSFYRILDEIENLDEVGIIKKGKEKYYVAKTIKNI